MDDGSITIKRKSSGAPGDIAIRNAINAAYDRHQPEPSEAELAKIGDEAEDKNVYGFDYKTDRHGRPVQQGIGALGRETGNHFAAIRRYEGQQAYERAVRELYRRDPARAKALNLPEPPRAGA